MANDMIGDSESTFSIQIMAARIFAMIVLGLGSFLLGLLPMISMKWLRPNLESSRVLSLLMSFGGGVLLFTTLLHLQPEVRESVLKLKEAGQLPNGHGTENLADLICIAGFFLAYAIDTIVHSTLDDLHVHNHAGHEVLHQSMSLRRRNYTVTASTSSQVQSTSELPATSAINDYGNEFNKEQYRSLACDMTSPTRPDDNQQQLQVRWAESDAEKQAMGPPEVDVPAVRSFSDLPLVLALSFHEVFEGLAIGLEERVDHVWYLFFAVASHKLIIALCIGMKLAGSGTKNSVLIAYVATFAFVTPVGIALGMLILHLGHTVDGEPGIMSVVLQGLAAGTLLYVVFYEVLPGHKISGLFNLLSVILGFSVLLLLQMKSEYLNRF